MDDLKKMAASLEQIAVKTADEIGGHVRVSIGTMDSEGNIRRPDGSIFKRAASSSNPKDKVSVLVHAYAGAVKLSFVRLFNEKIVLEKDPIAYSMWEKDEEPSHMEKELAAVSEIKKLQRSCNARELDAIQTIYFADTIKVVGAGIVCKYMNVPMAAKFAVAIAIMPALEKRYEEDGRKRGHGVKMSFHKSRAELAAVMEQERVDEDKFAVEQKALVDKLQAEFTAAKEASGGSL